MPTPVGNQVCRLFESGPVRARFLVRQRFAFAGGGVPVRTPAVMIGPAHYPVGSGAVRRTTGPVSLACPAAASVFGFEVFEPGVWGIRLDVSSDLDDSGHDLGRVPRQPLLRRDLDGRVFMSSEQ